MNILEKVKRVIIGDASNIDQRWSAWIDECDERLGRPIHEGRQGIDGYSGIEAWQAFSAGLSAQAYCYSVQNGPLWRDEQ